MSEYRPDIDKYILREGDLAYFVPKTGKPVKVRIELVTRARIYMSAGRSGDRWYFYEGRVTRRLCPRGVFDRVGRAFDRSRVLVLGR